MFLEGPLYSLFVYGDLLFVIFLFVMGFYRRKKEERKPYPNKWSSHLLQILRKESGWDDL